MGTGIGSALSFLIRGEQRTLSAALMGFAGGLMLSVAVLDIFPGAVLAAGTFSMACGAACGLLFVLLLSLLMSRRPNAGALLESQSRMLKRTGMLLCVGIAMHNFPEGVAVGSGMNLPGPLGWQLLLLIFLHDIAEGLAMSLPLALSRVRRRKILLLGFAAGSPTALGTLIGGALGSVSRLMVGGGMGFAGGAMLYLTIKEMIPETVRLKDKKTAFAAVGIGIAAGAAMVMLI